MKWFHFDCIGFLGSLEEAENFQFHCSQCEPQCTSPLKKRSPPKVASSPKKKEREKSPETIFQEQENNSCLIRLIQTEEKDPETGENIPICKRTRNKSSVLINSSSQKNSVEKAAKIIGEVPNVDQKIRRRRRKSEKILPSKKKVRRKARNNLKDPVKTPIIGKNKVVLSQKNKIKK